MMIWFLGSCICLFVLVYMMRLVRNEFVFGRSYEIEDISFGQWKDEVVSKSGMGCRRITHLPQSLFLALEAKCNIFEWLHSSPCMQYRWYGSDTSTPVMVTGDVVEDNLLHLSVSGDQNQPGRFSLHNTVCLQESGLAEWLASQQIANHLTSGVLRTGCVEYYDFGLGVVACEAIHRRSVIPWQVHYHTVRYIFIVQGVIGVQILPWHRGKSSMGGGWIYNADTHDYWHPTGTDHTVQSAPMTIIQPGQMFVVPAGYCYKINLLKPGMNTAIVSFVQITYATAINQLRDWIIC